MSQEVKIVVTLKEHAASVGVQAPNCDPVFSRVEGDLPAVLESVPALVEEAQRRWDASPRYPKCEWPLPSQTPPQVTPASHSPRVQVTAVTRPRMF